MSGFVANLFRSRDELLAENAMVRQPLIVAGRKVKQPAFRPLERGRVVALSSVVKDWQNAILLVKPETVLRWHREGTRLLWNRKSRALQECEPRISADAIELIREMAGAKRLWGSERIQGELLKLGIRVAKRTIQRHIRTVRPPGVASAGERSCATMSSGRWTSGRFATSGFDRCLRSSSST